MAQGAGRDLGPTTVNGRRLSVWRSFAGRLIERLACLTSVVCVSACSLVLELEGPDGEERSRPWGDAEGVGGGGGAGGDARFGGAAQGGAGGRPPGPDAERPREVPRDAVVTPDAARPPDAAVLGCPPPLRQAYPDRDGDGVGGRELTRECYDLDALPPGLSAVGTDCDDADPSVWRELSLYLDEDGDGFTGTLQVRCVGAEPPAGGALAPRPPPMRALGAQWVEAGEHWDNAHGVALSSNATLARCTRDAGRCGDVVLGGFVLPVVPIEVVEGVTVRIWLEMGLNLLDEPVIEVGLGLAGAEPHWLPVAAPQRNELREILIGGPRERWGLPVEATGTDWARALEIRLRPTLGIVRTRDVRVGHLQLEVHVSEGPPDCDDGDPERWSFAMAHPDLDGDGYGAGGEVIGCVGASGAGYSQLTGDCDDAHARAYPGATAYHAEPRAGGSFDYDCDGVETPQAIQSHTGCTAGTDGAPCAPRVASIDPLAACGALNEVSICLGNSPSCRVTHTTRPTQCR